MGSKKRKSAVAREYARAVPPQVLDRGDRARRAREAHRVRAAAERALDGQTAAVRTHSSKFIRQRATADKASQIREHGVRVQTAAARRRGGDDANRVRTGVFE